MIRAKNYEKLSKFIEVTAKILSVLFFQTRCRSTKINTFAKVIITAAVTGEKT